MGAQGLPGRRPVSGKQRYAAKTVRAGKREAQRLLNEMKVEAERGLATRTTATVGKPRGRESRRLARSYADVREIPSSSGSMDVASV
ncbi:MAG TPA: hypothetical protein VK860_10135, partial [Ilumatobacteraceae bacterium]|nr:hypothetical protein [Ilumatobacteraceae bacterium]